MSSHPTIDLIITAIGFTATLGFSIKGKSVLTLLELFL
jgi:hypothetical protein